MPLARLAVFVPDLSDQPSRHTLAALANHLGDRGFTVDVVAPMGGGPLRAVLGPRIGQIDLAKRHTRTSFLALARILAERRPAGLVTAGGDAALVAFAAAGLARTGAPLAVMADGRDDAPTGWIRALLRRCQLRRLAVRLDPGLPADALADRCLDGFGLPRSLVTQGIDRVEP